MAKFSIVESLEVGWNIAKENFALLLGGIILIMFAGSVPLIIMGLLAHLTEAESSTAQMFISIGSLGQFIISCGLTLGLVKISLALVDKKQTKFSELFSGFPLVFSCAVGYMVATLAVTVGSFLLLVPGIILLIKLQFFPYFIVEHDCGPIEALQKSWELTKNTKLQIFLFDLAILLMIMLGSLCFGVGVFISLVIACGAGAFVFRKLESSHEPAVPVEPVQ